jgi:hypothetical protein
LALTQPKLAQYWNPTEDEGRGYRHPFTGEMAPGVTSVLKLENKDDLTRWAVGIAVQWCVDNWMVLGERSDEAAFNIARNKPASYRNERAQVGDGVHGYIEALNTDAWDFPELDDEQQAMVANYLEFAEAYSFKPIYNEVTLWDTVSDTAGTADAIGYLEGPDIPAGLYILDWKTSKRIYDSHYMQLAALKNCDEMLLEVPEGTEGASKPFIRDVKQADGTRKKDTSFWVRQPVPAVDGAVVVHIRADTGGAYRLDPEKEPWYLQEFLAYRSAWQAQAERAKIDKKEGGT